MVILLFKKDKLLTHFYSFNRSTVVKYVLGNSYADLLDIIVAC